MGLRVCAGREPFGRLLTLAAAGAACLPVPGIDPGGARCCLAEGSFSRFHPSAPLFNIFFPNG